MIVSLRNFSTSQMWEDFRMITTIAVIYTPVYLTSNGADLALDMISNNIYIKRSKITNDLVMILYSPNT